MRVKSTENLSNIGASVGHLGLGFFILSKCLHLVFYFLQNRGGGRGHRIEVLEVLGELVREVFLNSLDKEVQVFHVILHLS